MSQTDFAAAIPASDSVVSKWIRAMGNTVPPGYHHRVVEVLKLDADESEVLKARYYAWSKANPPKRLTDALITEAASQ